MVKKNIVGGGFWGKLDLIHHIFFTSLMWLSDSRIKVDRLELFCRLDDCQQPQKISLPPWGFIGRNHIVTYKCFATNIMFCSLWISSPLFVLMDCCFAIIPLGKFKKNKKTKKKRLDGFNPQWGGGGFGLSPLLTYFFYF